MTANPDIRRKRLWHLLIATAIVVMALTWLALPPGQTLYPEVVIQAPNGLRIEVIKKPYNTPALCRDAVERTASAMQAFCPDCELLEVHCLKGLSPRQRRALDSQPLDQPVLRFAQGVILFSAPDPALASAECRASAMQSGQPQNCTAPDTTALALNLSQQPHAPAGSEGLLSTYGLILAISLLVTWLACLLIAYTARWHGHLTFDQPGLGPQNNHAAPVPRVGGVAVACGIVATLLAFHHAGLLHNDATSGFIGLAAAALPAFAGGLAEDITRRVGVLPRLLLTMASGALASILLGATLTRLDVPLLDTALAHWPVFAVAFTAFAVAGVANATNIIDGANGLVGGFAVLVLGAYAWVAYQVDDQLVLIASLLMLGPVLGFLPWNWPRGRIFMGDGGAYLLGFWLAELGVLLVVRNPEVSPWFPLAVMAWPIWETVFSMYRRKVLRGHTTGKPDNQHMHQLIHQRLIQRVSRTGTDIHSHVALYVWIGTTIVAISAVFAWPNTSQLIVIALAFSLIYMWLYWKLSSKNQNKSDPFESEITSRYLK